MIASFALVALAAASPTVDQDALNKCAAVSKVQVARLRALAHEIESDAEYADTHNNEFSPEMKQRYFIWYRKRQSDGENYPDLHQIKLSLSEQYQRQQSIEAFLDHQKAERDGVIADYRARLIQACPWKADEIRSRN